MVNMTLMTLPRFGLLLLVFLVGFGDITAARALDRSTYVPGSLQDAYVTLVQAKPLYKGHRILAMAHVRAAVRELGGKIVANRFGDREPGADSDTKMHTAQRLLQQARYGLYGEALNHVTKAIQEISVGLSER